MSVSSIETSATRANADITYRVDKQAHVIVLDFRQLPAIKIDALHRLMFHTPEQPSMDLASELSLFADHLWLRYGTPSNDLLQMALVEEFSYEIVIHLNYGVKARDLTDQLKTYFRKNAGIVLRYVRKS